MRIPLHRLLPAAIVLVPVLTMACASRTAPVSNPSPQNGIATNMAASPETDVAATLVVERFLRAANANDLDAMASIFGNREGPISRRGRSEDVDRRMFVLASALRHDSYSVVGSEIVPGRRDEAMKIVVKLTMKNRSVDVPFTIVKSRNDRLLVEDFDLVKILSGN